MGGENNSVATAPATAELDKAHDTFIQSFEKYIPSEVTEDLKGVVANLTAYKTNREAFAKQRAEFEKTQAAQNAPPENYDLKLPKDSTLGETYVETVKAYAKEHKLSQAQASAILEDREKTAAYVITSRKAEFQKVLDANAAALKSHPVLGGDNLGKVEELSTRFLETYGPKGIVEKLKASGALVDPEIVEMIYKAAQAIGPEKLIMPKNDTKTEVGQIPASKPPESFSKVGVNQLQPAGK